jgi:acetyltransferase-like isoleucine patch superfamily enzyme
MARIELGRSVGVSGASLCAATTITIGDNVLIGADVLITDTDHHGLGVDGDRSISGAASAPIFIGSGAFIGARALILKGVSIGENAIVGAGSVVTRAVPPATMVAGNPARQVAVLGRTVARQE